MYHLGLNPNHNLTLKCNTKLNPDNTALYPQTITHCRRHVMAVGCVAIGNPERHIRKASHCGSKQQQRSCAAISLTIACLRYIYNGVILHALPVRGESHNQRNATGEVATVAWKLKCCR